jgi:hypothetical protein
VARYLSDISNFELAFRLLDGDGEARLGLFGHAASRFFVIMDLDAMTIRAIARSLADLRRNGAKDFRNDLIVKVPFQDCDDEVYALTTDASIKDEVWWATYALSR